MNINEFELKNVLNLTPEKRYSYFIKKVVDYSKLWTLVHEDETWVFAQIEDYTLLSFWPAKEYAQLLIENTWKDVVPKELDLEACITLLKHKYNTGNYLINIFSKPEKTGFVVNLDEFINDISNELNRYH